MSTPRKIDIIPDCGLTIEVVDYSSFEGIDHTHSPLPWKYKITNGTNIVDDTENGFGEELFYGLLSPTASITIPPMGKRQAGIPDKATTFAFMYPPQELAEKFATENNHEETCLKIFDCHDKDQKAIISAIILGGYAYFDDDFRCICINALSMKRSIKSDKDIKFSGPFEVNQAACVELYNMDCTQPLMLDIFREVGFERFAWVRPKEKVRFKPIPMGYKDNNGTFVSYENNHGALLFFRENGTAAAYAVDASEYHIANGDVGFITEAVDCIKEAEFIKRAVQTIHEVKAWGEKVKHLEVKAVDSTKFIEELEDIEKLDDRRTLVHQACHAALGIKFVSLLLNAEEKFNLSHQDGFGWNPLHYACRFSPKDCDLIKLLIKECPNAVTQCDQCGRYPLHIACDSDASEDVIAELLAADDFSDKKTINQKTIKLGLLPLHFACYRGASENIIKALLDADNDGSTAIDPTRTGKLPLHLVILRKAPASMIKILLDADSKLHDSGNETASTYNADVYKRAQGKLPLHLACWNNSSSDTIKMLLEKDKNNTTIDETIGVTSSGVAGRRMTRLTHDPSSFLDDQPFHKSFFEQCGDGDDGEGPDGVVSLHLAMKHGSTDVISLLLQKEIEKEKEEPDALRLSTLCRRDSRGRTPLHIACEYNVDPQIIQLLIELDPLKKTTQFDDDQGFRPLHYACEHKDTSPEIVNILCDAEEQCIHKLKKDNGKETRRSTHSGDSERKRTPLYLAVRTGAPTKVIERLLHPEHFTLKGFDDPAMMDFAGIVKDSTAIQDKVIDKLSERLNFSIIITELLFNILALVSFMCGSKKLLDGNMTRIEPSLLVLCSVFFLLRELLQIMSVGSDYIGDLWSWYELVCIVFLLIKAADMFEMADDNLDNSAEILTHQIWLTNLTGGLLVGQIIIYLRSTFLPFARFVDGLLTIVRCLIPFLIVSSLLLLSYVYAFWINNNCGECNEGNHHTLNHCAQFVIVRLFNFEPQTNDANPYLMITFGYMVAIILLNIVIAIVCEAWGTATERSTLLFWKFRLEKIKEVYFAEKLRNYFPTFPKFRRITRYIDGVENMSYGDDIPWTKAPFHHIKTKDHYDKPRYYFDADLANTILKVKSLQADLYWNDIDAKSDDMDAGGKYTSFISFDKFTLILKWLGAGIFYMILIILGIPTAGLLWPKNFRSGVLLLGRRKTT